MHRTSAVSPVGLYFFRRHRRRSSPIGCPEDDVNRTVVEVDRLPFGISQDITVQTLYLSGEQRNMTGGLPAIKTASVRRQSSRGQSANAGSLVTVQGQRPLVDPV